MAIAMSENTGSWRVMEKAGMRYEGLVNYYGLVGLKKYVRGQGNGGDHTRPRRVTRRCSVEPVAESAHSSRVSRRW